MAFTPKKINPNNFNNNNEYIDGVDSLQAQAVNGLVGAVLYNDQEINANKQSIGNKIDKSEKNSPNGVATLDSDGKVPTQQLPSYVDGVIEGTLTSEIQFTATNGTIYTTGTAGIESKQFFDINTKISYRWSGSQFVGIVNNLALGETSNTAYSGAKGKENRDKINQLENKFNNCSTKEYTNKVADVRYNLIQLIDIPNIKPTSTQQNITFTNNNNGSILINGTANDIGEWTFINKVVTKVNHKYYFSFLDNGQRGPFWYDDHTNRYYMGSEIIFTAETNSFVCGMDILNNSNYNATISPNLIDLTETFGAGNEPTTVEEVQQYLTPNKYYKYKNNIDLLWSQKKGVPGTKEVTLPADIISKYKAFIVYVSFPYACGEITIRGNLHHVLNDKSSCLIPDELSNENQLTSYYARVERNGNVFSLPAIGYYDMFPTFKYTSRLSGEHGEIYGFYAIYGIK